MESLESFLDYTMNTLWNARGGHGPTRLLASEQKQARIVRWRGRYYLNLDTGELYKDMPPKKPQEQAPAPKNERSHV